MTTYQRRQYLLKILEKDPGLRIPEIARELNVSDGTVRNDLNALEEDGHLKRVHGGAVLAHTQQAPSAGFFLRNQENVEEKVSIGKEAAKLVHDGDSFFLDASSTVYYFSQNLINHNRLRIVTNGIDVSCLLAKNPSNTIILIGGIVGQDGSSVTGLLSEKIIAELHIQKAFVSCSGFSIERGMTEINIEEVQLKRKAMESVEQVIALVGSKKMGKNDLTSFFPSNQITHLFTDIGITENWKSLLQQANIAYTVCGPVNQ
jgi:DeoR/GlpR family transcriptional regulator of sugar metabolism